MAIIFFLIGIILLAGGVIGWLILSLKNEEREDIEHAAVPIRDLGDFDGRPQAEEVLSPASSSAEDEGIVPLLQESLLAPSGMLKVPLMEQEKDAPPIAPVAPVVENKARAYEEEIQQLKEEVKLIREKAVVQARNAIEVITKLREANERFQVERDRSSIGESELHHLKAENAALKEQVDSGLRDASGLRAEIKTLRSDLIAQRSLAQVAQTQLESLAYTQENKGGIEVEREKIAAEIQRQGQDQVNGLRAEIEMLRSRLSAKSGMTDSIDSTSSEGLVALQKALDILHEQKEDLEARLRELSSVNTIQAEKNNFLQYELTKSRAQAIGLERAYENSRQQIDELSRQIRSSEVNSREIKKRADVLERSLLDFKRLSGELLKQEKLSGFESEKRAASFQGQESRTNGFPSSLQQVVPMGEEASGH